MHAPYAARRRRRHSAPKRLALLGSLTLAGAAFGILAYATLAFLGQPSRPLAELVWPLTPTRRLFALVGATFGFAVGAEAARLFRLANLLQHLVGTVLGGIAGLLLYGIGYVATNYPGLPASRYYLLYYVEALYSFTVVEAMTVTLGAVIGFFMVRYTWRFYGVLTYVALVATVLGYILYAVTVTLPRVPPSGLPLSVVLLVAEAGSLGMVTIYAFYSLDIFVKKRWRRSPDKVAFSKYYLPKVAFHVTVINEPVEMVTDTLRSLLAVDYPRDRYVVMVLDDSTNDDLRRPLEAYCLRHGISYVHRDHRAGFKAGALNNGLSHTPRDVDLVAVIDADYQVEPEYLKETVGYFVNPNLGFLQTPQDYRNMHQSFLTQQYYYADAYFYRAILPSRNEENTIIFCGTMGVIRRSALEAVGGWGEQYICEDAEISVRVLEKGYDSMYVNKTYGRGLIPATFEAYKKQHYRWSSGGVKILTGHFRKFLFSHLSLRQKFDFLIGGIHWFDGVYIVTIGAIVGILGFADLLGIPVVTYHQREIWLIGLVPLFLLVDGVTRLHMALRRSMNLSYFGTFRVMGMWFAIKFNNMFAAISSLLGARLAFVRTPKAPENRLGRVEAFVRAVGLTKFETTFSATLFTISAGSVWKTYDLLQGGGVVLLARVFLFFWLVYYALIFASAPYYAYKAYVTFTPDKDLFPRPAARRLASGD